MVTQFSYFDEELSDEQMARAWDAARTSNASVFVVENVGSDFVVRRRRRRTVAPGLRTARVYDWQADEWTVVSFADRWKYRHDTMWKAAEERGLVKCVDADGCGCNLCREERGEVRR